MRDRLADLINEAKDEYPAIPTVNCCKPTFAYYLADRLLAEGAILPPCKVGDTVFIIDEGDEGSEPYVLDVVITAYGYDVSGFWATLNLPLGLKMSAHFGERMFGKTVFLTREEAEQALNEKE